MFWDEPSVSNVYLLLGSFIWVTCWELKFRSQGQSKQNLQRCFKSLFVLIILLFIHFCTLVSVGFIMLQKSRSFPRSIIQGSVSHRQSLKFHRKQFGGWVIWKVRWVHMSALYLCLWLWVSVLFMSGERRCLLSQGWFLADGHRGVKPHFIWRVFLTRSSCK